MVEHCVLLLLMEKLGCKGTVPYHQPLCTQMALGRVLNGLPEATYSPNDTQPHGTCTSDTSEGAVSTALPQGSDAKHSAPQPV